MRLLVVRHGECEANVRGVVAGSRDDSPLTQHGVDEAVQTAKNVMGFRGPIISSPLQRAMRTAEIIRDIIEPRVTVGIEPLFIERDVGDATGKPLAEYFALEKAGILAPNAETIQAMFDRVKQGIEKLKQLDVPVLVVTHNGTYRMLVCVVQGLPAQNFANIPSIQNGEVKIIEI